MTVDPRPVARPPGAVEGGLSLVGVAVLLWSWASATEGRAPAVGAQLLLAAVAWRLGRSWLSGADGSTSTAGAELGPHEIGRVAATFALPIAIAVVVARHSGRAGTIVSWSPGDPLTESVFGHLWIVPVAVGLVVVTTLLQRMLASVVARWRVWLVLVAGVAAAFSLREWLGSEANPALGEVLSGAASSWGFASALAVATALPVADPDGVRRGSRLGQWSLVPLNSVHTRPARWLVAAHLWGWPAVSIFASDAGSGLSWLPLVVLVPAVIAGASATSLGGHLFRGSATLPAATRRAVGVAALAAAVFVGTSAAAAAGGSSGAPATRADAAGLLAVAVPSFEVVVPRPLDVLLVGDSTMAPMRWFREGQASLKGFEYVLDVESCRRIAKRSCWGRESRIPTSAALAISSRRRNFDYVVLMAGAHSTRRDLADEIRMAQEAAEARGAKLLIVTLRESIRYTAADSVPGESAFVEFNRIIRDLAEELGPEKVALVDWNTFSFRESQWFRSDGIHPNLEGTIALGWLISQAVAADAGNPCPYDWQYPCTLPDGAGMNRNWLGDFGVTPTEEHCYEDGNARIPICQRDRRM